MQWLQMFGSKTVERVPFLEARYTVRPSACKQVTDVDFLKFDPPELQSLPLQLFYMAIVIYAPALAFSQGECPT